MKWLSLLPFLLACSTDQPTCSPDDSGFGGAPAVKLTSLASPAVPASNPCRPRLDVLRTQAELASAYTELGVVDVPTNDFASSVLIVRVATDPAAIAWSVQDKGKIVVGFRGCQEPAEAACSASFYTAPAAISGVDSRTCESVHCGFTPGAQ